MQLSSMTGFARAQKEFVCGAKKYSCFWEIKSVNGKNMDVKMRLPQGLENLDADFRRICSGIFYRGNFNASLELKSENTPEIQFDQDMIEALLAEAVKIYQKNLDFFAKPSPLELFRMNGVMKMADQSLNDDEKKLLQAEICQSLTLAVEALKDDRIREGQKLAASLNDILEKIAEVVQNVEDISRATPEKLKDKIRHQIKELEPDLPISEDRLAQEVLLMVLRADIKEELDRLKAHLNNAREILNEGGPVGRRLDFLCQEMNREANTMCSKSTDIGQTRCGMDLKALIEQFREQVQNIE